MAQPHRRSGEHQHRLAAWQTPVTLRSADDADRESLDRLAQLDSRPLPPGPHLVAERQGRIEAAISLVTGELVADPFTAPRSSASFSAVTRARREFDPSPLPQGLSPLGLSS